MLALPMRVEEGTELTVKLLSIKGVKSASLSLFITCEKYAPL